jgi:hypothetical protein
MGGVRTVALNLALTLGAFAFAFLSLEAGLRVADGVPLTSTENFIAKRIDLIRVNAGPVAYDPTLGWRLTDYYAPEINRVAVTIGEHGVRMNQSQSVAPPERAIVVVGSSATFGIGVTNEHAWPARLERLLGEPVVNAAGEDWGMDQIVLRAERIAQTLKPKLLFVVVTDEDVQRNGYSVFRGAPKPYFVIERGALVQKAPGKADTLSCIVGTGQRDHAIAQRLVERLAKLHGASTDVRLVLAYDRYTLRKGHRPMAMAVLAGTAVKHGLAVSDSFDALVAHAGSMVAEPRVWVEPVAYVSPCAQQEQPYMSIAGHELMAGFVAAQLRGSR